MCLAVASLLCRMAILFFFLRISQLNPSRSQLPGPGLLLNIVLAGRLVVIFFYQGALYSGRQQCETTWISSLTGCFSLMMWPGFELVGFWRLQLPTGGMSFWGLKKTLPCLRFCYPLKQPNDFPWVRSSLADRKQWKGLGEDDNLQTRYVSKDFFSCLFITIAQRGYLKTIISCLTQPIAQSRLAVAKFNACGLQSGESIFDNTVMQTRKKEQPRKCLKDAVLLKSLMCSLQHLRPNPNPTRNPAQPRPLCNTLESDHTVQSDLPLARHLEFKDDGLTIEQSLVNKSSFQFQFIIGRGAFGRVWKVAHKRTRTAFAVKEMSKAVVLAKKSVSSVLNEKELLTRLKSNSIVNMHYAFQDRQNLYLVMDYLPGGDLRHHIGLRRFSQKEAKFLIVCLVQGLAFLHKNHVVHRDIKPQNLVFDERGYLRITDLGISKLHRPENSSDTSGTPGYMAPQILCRQNYSYEADFFAVGVILYQLMLEERPYSGRNRKEIRDLILAKQVQIRKGQIPPGWSPQAADLANRLIQRKPSSRLGVGGATQVVAHPWFKEVNWRRITLRDYQPPFHPKSRMPQSALPEEQDLDCKELLEKNCLLLRGRDCASLFENYYFDSCVKTQKGTLNKRRGRGGLVPSTSASSKNSSNLLDLCDKLTRN